MCGTGRVSIPLIKAGVNLTCVDYSQNIFAYTTPLQTAIVFISFVIFMDLFLVAMVINKSFGMFKSFIGTWLPFILIFTATYLTGVLLLPLVFDSYSKFPLALIEYSYAGERLEAEMKVVAARG